MDKGKQQKAKDGREERERKAQRQQPSAVFGLPQSRDECSLSMANSEETRSEESRHHCHLQQGDLATHFSPKRNWQMCVRAHTEGVTACHLPLIESVTLLLKLFYRQIIAVRSFNFKVSNYVYTLITVFNVYFENTQLNNHVQIQSLQRLYYSL